MPEVGEHLADDRLQEWLDGELAPDVAASIKAHLAHCAICSQQVSRYRELYVSLEQLEQRTPSIDLTPAVLARLASGTRPRDWLAWLLAGQLLLAGLVMSLTWSRITTLTSDWLSIVPQPQLLLSLLRTALQGLRLTAPVLPWDSLRTALELPSHWGLNSLVASWPAWGAALVVGFVVWTGINGWMLRTGIDSAGASRR